MSAVSKRVMPASMALWMTGILASRPRRAPKLLQPRPTRETRGREAPRLRFSMKVVPYLGREGKLPRWGRVRKYAAAPPRLARWASTRGTLRTIDYERPKRVRLDAAAVAEEGQGMALADNPFI